METAGAGTGAGAAANADTVVEALALAHDEILRSACASLGRWHLSHYEQLGVGEPVELMGHLLELVEDTVRRRRVEAMVAYATSLAEERFAAGFEIGEVQTVFNVLEEAIWRKVIARLPADHLVEGAGLVGTALGAGKDALARSWVALASRRRAPALDFGALFEGVAAG